MNKLDKLLEEAKEEGRKQERRRRNGQNWLERLRGG